MGAALKAGARALELVSPGIDHGRITRLFSPQDIGERLKPFVFLDFLHADIGDGLGFDFHPHSGIATLTYQLTGDVNYEDTAGQKGVVQAQGLEWMQAGGGVWHQGHLTGTSRAEGFQLWVALGPDLEDGPSLGLYVPPTDVPQIGNTRVLLGEWQGAASPIPAPQPMHYFHVDLAVSERWDYQPPSGFDIAWAFVFEGALVVNDKTSSRQLLVWERSESPISVTALGSARFMFGAAVAHHHDLVLGPSSVHTNQRSLDQGAQRIAELGQALVADGRMRRR